MESEHNSSEQYIRNLKVSGGFEVPEGYFESLELMLGSIDEPAIAIKAENAFMVPDTYFENLEKNILAKTADRKAKVIPLYQVGYFKLASGIAAVLVLGCLLYFYAGNEQPANDTIANADPTEEEIINYLGKEDYAIDQLCDAGWCNELNELGKKENNELENYLLEHSDQGLLIEEL